jgi:hypothetical protein
VLRQAAPGASAGAGPGGRGQSGAGRKQRQHSDATAAAAGAGADGGAFSGRVGRRSFHGGGAASSRSDAVGEAWVEAEGGVIDD